MSDTINAMIMQGGRGVASPIERHLTARKENALAERNSIATDVLKQQLETGQTDAINSKQDREMKLSAAFLRNVTDETTYLQATSALKAKYGISSPPKYNPQQVAGLISHVYGAAKGTRRNALVDGKTVPAIETETGQLRSPATNQAMPTATLSGTGGARRSAAKIKMDELIAGGMPKETARAVAYGSKKVRIDPTTGDVITVDIAGNLEPEVISKGDKKQKELDKKVTDFSKGVEKSGIGETDAVMKEVEDAIMAIRKDDENADIPGFGLDASLPDFTLSSQGKSLRQRVKTLFNQTLKKRSGAAVTSSELSRLKEEFGQGLIKTDEQLLDSLNRFRGIIERHKLTLAAGYDDEVVDTWQSRSGLTLRKTGQKKNTVSKRYKLNPETGKLEAQ